MWRWLRKWLGFAPETPSAPSAPVHDDTRPLDPSGRGGRELRPRRIVAYPRVVQVQTQSEGAAAAEDGQTLALVAGANGPKWLIMRCPCGCREIRRISLSPQIPPAWHITIEPGPLVSLSPSVFLRRECRAHFVLSRSRALVT